MMEDDLVLNIAYKIEQQLKEGEFDVYKVIIGLEVHCSFN